MCKNAADSDFSELQRRMMGEALTQARAAAAANEVPVGAVIYDDDGAIVSAAANETIAAKDVGAHAEMLALRRASAVRGNHRLPRLHMVVTLEPCAMCIGAVFHARLATLIFAASDPKGGACGGVVDLPQYKLLNHHTSVRGGLRADEAAALLRDFFAARR